MLVINRNSLLGLVLGRAGADVRVYHAAAQSIRRALASRCHRLLSIMVESYCGVRVSASEADTTRATLTGLTGEYVHSKCLLNVLLTDATKRAPLTIQLHTQRTTQACSLYALRAFSDSGSLVKRAWPWCSAWDLMQAGYSPAGAAHRILYRTCARRRSSIYSIDGWRSHGEQSLQDVDNYQGKGGYKSRW